MSVSNFLRYFLLILFLVSVLALGVNSCAAPEESATSADTAATSTDDGDTTDDGGTTDDNGGTTTTTITTTTKDLVTGVIYQAITVKKKPKDPSIRYSSLTDELSTSLSGYVKNFGNAQFGNVKFQ